MGAEGAIPLSALANGSSFPFGVVFLQIALEQHPHLVGRDGYVKIETRCGSLGAAVSVHPAILPLPCHFLEPSTDGETEIPRRWARRKSETGEPELKRRTLVMIASQHGAVDVLQHLLKRGCNVDTQSPDDGFTALHCAFSAGNPRLQQVLITLVKAGANTEIMDFRGRKAVDLYNIMTNESKVSRAVP